MDDFYFSTFSDLPKREVTPKEASKDEASTAPPTTKETDNPVEGSSTASTTPEETQSAAPTSTGYGWGFSSFSELVDTVKKKSESAVSIAKRDLSEFATVLREDTNEALGAASHQIQRVSTAIDASRIGEDGEVMGGRDMLTGLANRTRTTLAPTTKEAQRVMGRVGSGVRGIWQDTVAALTEDSTDEGSTPPPSLPGQTPNRIFTDRTDGKMASLRADSATFLSDPTEALPEDGKEWSTFLTAFLVQERAQEISELLRSDPSLRDMMVSLVPVQVAYDLFWARYFYREAALRQEETARRRRLQEAASAKVAEDDFDWGDDDEEEVVSLAEKESSKSSSPAVAPTKVEEVEVAKSEKDEEKDEDDDKEEDEEKKEKETSDSDSDWNPEDEDIPVPVSVPKTEMTTAAPPS